MGSFRVVVEAPIRGEDLGVDQRVELFGGERASLASCSLRMICSACGRELHALSVDDGLARETLVGCRTARDTAEDDAISVGIPASHVDVAEHAARALSGGE